MSVVIGCMSDQHQITNTNYGGANETLARWLWAQPGLDGVIMGGDGYNLRTWMDNIGWPESIPVFPVPGNWDADIIPSSSDRPGAGVNPYLGFCTEWSANFTEGDPWFYEDVGNVRIVVGCNNGNENGNYPNCNPVDNADWAGFVTADSAQQTFIRDAVSEATGWVILAVHRGIVAPFSGSSRRNVFAARTDLMRDLAADGLDIVATGDQHVRFVTKKVNSVDDDSAASGLWLPTNDRYGVGCYYVGTMGGYATRDIDTDEMPANSLYYASGDNNAQGTASAWIARFDGRSCCFRYVEATIESDTPTLVWAGTLYRNMGGSLEQ